ncbi:MAG: OmpA family protein [Kiritimatiellia bacterium]
MRTSLVLTLLTVATLLVSGCSRKGAGGADDALLAGGGGDDVLINAHDPNAMGGDAAGAYGERFEDTRERINDSGLEALLFSFDSYTLPSDEIHKADAAAQYLMSNPNYVMIVEGHCDERGSNEYNLSLSEQRAIGVKDYMVSLGIDTNRIQTRAFGEEKPANPGHEEESYHQNRRAEFVPYK